jgi:CHAT domain-containing protein
VDAIVDWVWNAVYAPMRDFLARYETAYVVASSYLSIVPLHAAREQSTDRFALTEVELRYAPSAGALAAASRRSIPPRAARVLLVPQPTGAGAHLAGADAEIEAIGQELEDALRLDPARITVGTLGEAIGEVGWLHAACHGVINAADPLESGLRLGNGQRFTLRDLAAVRHGHLLGSVLSACQTNVPDPDLPDEALSLASGFLFGGCRSVIASSWQVPDPATAELMRRCYVMWQPDEASMSSALRRAQLSFIAGDETERWKPEWRAPYYWAGFAYSGP